MKSNETWAVALDLTKMDTHVLKYTRFLSSHFRPKKLYFIHVVKESHSVFYLPSEYQDLNQLYIVDQKFILESKVEKYFKDSGISYQCHVASGTPLDEIMDMVERMSINMVIAGKKKVSGGSGVVSDRLSRNLPCNFLIVPEISQPKLSNILVPTDFSEHSTMAMEKAIELRRSMVDLKIFTHHSYIVPTGYSKSGKSYEQFAEIMKSNSEKEMKRWLKKFPMKPVESSDLINSTSLSSQIIDFVTKNNVNLIIVGSKGHTRESLALLGSNTMKLLKINNSIPIMIVKKKGENIKLLDALRKL